jgi:hypothetical protein
MTTSTAMKRRKGEEEQGRVPLFPSAPFLLCHDE